MGKPDTDAVFAGSLPQVYQKHLVPLIFEPYAEDLVLRLEKCDATNACATSLLVEILGVPIAGCF